MAVKSISKDSRDLIMSHLKKDDRNLRWLSNKTKIPYSTLYFILVRKERTLSDAKKQTINKTLQTDF